MIFYNFCYYFWGQHCWWTETNIGNDFFLSFHFFQLFYYSPCPTSAMASPKYACLSTNFAKMLVASLNMTLYCDVTNSIYPITMTTMRHCSILDFGRGHPFKQSPRASPYLCTPLRSQRCFHVTFLFHCRLVRRVGDLEQCKLQHVQNTHFTIPAFMCWNAKVAICGFSSFWRLHTSVHITRCSRYIYLIQPTQHSFTKVQSSDTSLKAG